MSWPTNIPAWLFPIAFFAAVLLIVFLIFSGGKITYDGGLQYLSANKIEEFNSARKLFSNAVVLAMARIDEGNLLYHTEGVEFDGISGNFRFPNQYNLDIIPIITDYTNNGYVTNTHIITEITSPQIVRIEKNALNNNTVVSGPDCFTIVVLGIHNVTDSTS